MINKSINIIYLNIAGFYIKIDFLPRLSGSKHYLKINNLYEKINKILKDFIIFHKPQKIDLYILIKKQNLLTINKKKSFYQYNYLVYYIEKDNYIETYQHISISHFMFLLIRILQKLLVRKKGFFLHASASVINDDAFVFVGRPNAGKSTIIQLIRKAFTPIADDGIIIRKEKANFYLYQTPDPDKFSWISKSPHRYNIRKIFFLRKSKEIKIIKIEDKNKIFSLLINQLWTTDVSLPNQISPIKEFIEFTNNFYYLYFPKVKDKLIGELYKLTDRH